MVDPRLLAMWLRETARPPLPAGDPVAWSVLTEGTVLDGAPWTSGSPQTAPLQDVAA